MRKLFGDFDVEAEEHCVQMDEELIDPFLAFGRILEKIRFLYEEMKEKSVVEVTESEEKKPIQIGKRVVRDEDSVCTGRPPKIKCFSSDSVSEDDSVSEEEPKKGKGSQMDIWEKFCNSNGYAPLPATKYHDYCMNVGRDYRIPVKFSGNVVKICSRLEGTEKFYWAVTKQEHKYVYEPY